MPSFHGCATKDSLKVRRCTFRRFLLPFFSGLWMSVMASPFAGPFAVSPLPDINPGNDSNPLPKPPTGFQPYIISNWVAGALYIALILWSLLNLYTHLKSRLLIDAPKLLFAHIAAWGIALPKLNNQARATFAFFPSSLWIIISGNNTLQVALDLLPELLFLFIFALLIAMWAHVFARSRTLKLRRPDNILWIAHIVLSTALLLGAAILVVVVAVCVATRAKTTYSKDYLKWESYWLIASASIILLGTIIFGIGVARSLSQMQLISDFLKKQAKKVRLLIVVTFCAIVIKVVYNLLLNGIIHTWLSKDRINRSKGFAAIFFFYLFAVDILPVAFILTVFVVPRKNKKTKSGHEYVPYSDGEGDSDGLLSRSDELQY